MTISNNYPPGLTGAEDEIIGPSYTVESIWAMHHPVTETEPRDVICPGCGEVFPVYGIEYCSVTEDHKTVKWSGVCADCKISWGVEFDE